MGGGRGDAPRSVLVVGACGGIGRATALALAREGYRLVLLDSRAAPLEHLAAILSADGSAAVAHVASLTDSQRLQDVAATVRDTDPRLYAIVNAAGIFHYASIEETGADDWRKVIEADLTGVFLVIRAFLDLLRESEYARIVNVVSTASKTAFSHQTAYTAAKWGALGLSHALNAELRASRIYTTAICPGAVNTALWEAAPQFDRTAMLRPEAVAETIAFVLRQPGDVVIDEIVITPSRGTL